MGLILSADKYDEQINVGYLSFSVMREKIAYTYSKKHGDLYNELLRNGTESMPDDFSAKWNEGCDNDLDILLWHSDFEGELSPEECEKIYVALKKLEVKFNDEHFIFLYDSLLQMLDYCRKTKVPMIFS